MESNPRSCLTDFREFLHFQQNTAIVLLEFVIFIFLMSELGGGVTIEEEEENKC